jgi:transcriptional regulator GlxA family with amidase domain
VLDGLPATTHWLWLDRLGAYGATPTRQRVVEQGRVITAAGVSAGIDMALSLAARVAGPIVAETIQLGLEYDPQPPFDAGAPDKAPAQAVELCRASMSAREERAAARAH